MTDAQAKSMWINRVIYFVPLGNEFRRFRTHSIVLYRRLNGGQRYEYFSTDGCWHQLLPPVILSTLVPVNKARALVEMDEILGFK